MPRDYRRHPVSGPGSDREVIFGPVNSVNRKHAWERDISQLGEPFMFCTREFCSKKWYPNQSENSRGECRGK